MKWEELSMRDRTAIMAAAVRNGYTDIRSIKEAYANYQNRKLSAGNRYAEGGNTDDFEVVNPLDSIPTFDEDIVYDTNSTDEIPWFIQGTEHAPNKPLTNQEYYTLMEEVAEENNPIWNALRRKRGEPELTPEEEFARIINDNSYDYRSYYNDPSLRDEHRNADTHWTDHYKTVYHPTFSNQSLYSGKIEPNYNPQGKIGGTWLPYDTFIPNDTFIPENYAYGGNLFDGVSGTSRMKKKSRLSKGRLGISDYEREKAAYYRNELIKRGITNPVHLDAIIANMAVESTFNPSAADGTGAHGLMQWMGSRIPKDMSEKGQLDYIAKTYNHFGGNDWLNKDAYKRFNTTNDPVEAANLMRIYWERCAPKYHYKAGAWLNLYNNNNNNTIDTYHPMQDVTWADTQARRKRFELTPEEKRLLDSKPTLFYNADYTDWQNPNNQKTFEQAYAPYALNSELDNDYSNGWALYNSLLQSQNLSDPLSWMATMASLSPKTTPQQKEAANTMYQLFSPQGDDYMYHGLNFAAYGGKVNRFGDGGFYDLPEQRAYRKAVNLKAPYTNYEDAVDMDDNIMLRLKKFFDRGVSNCTLTASQFFNPARPIGRARTIVQDSIPNGFYEVDENHVVPGTMVIASYPNMSDYNPDQKYHTMVVTGFAPEDYEYTFRDGTKYQIKKGEPLVSYSRGKASPDNYITGIPLSVYNDKGEGKTYNRYYRPIDEEYPEYMLPNLIITNQKANGGHLFAPGGLRFNLNIYDTRFAEGGNLFYKGGLEDQFANTYLGIGQFPDYDSDFIATNNLQYLPYSQLNMMGHDPENIRIGNQGNQTMRAYDDKDATYLADANGNLVTSPLLRQMTQDYVKEHYGPMLLKAFLSNPDKYWDEYNRYRNSAITFDENRSPVGSGLPPIEKPIEPVAPEFWLLSAGASKAPSALNSVISPLFNMTAVDNMIDDVTPYSSWGNMMSQNVGGPEWTWNLIHPSFTSELFTNAARKALTAGINTVRELPEASRNLVASTAINYGAKTKELPTNIYKQRRAFNIGTGKSVWDYDPFVEFINSKRDVPSNTSFFHRAPRDVDILKIGDGRYRAKGDDYVIHPGGTVDGKFVSYGEPWMEFGTGQNSAWYEFPTSMNKGGRGPYRMATDWRGNQMDYDVTQAYEQMMIRNNPEFQKAEKEYLWTDFNSREEARQASKKFNEKWGIDPSVNVYDIYHSNQTVIPNELWNFNSEYPRGFLSQPFWRYTQNPYSGAVQKELIMNWESPMKALDKTHADIIPFLDETGKWDYLTDFRNKP